MNSKMSYLIRTIGHLHLRGSQLRPVFRTATRTYRLGINRHNSAIQNANLRRFLLNVLHLRPESPLRLLSQGMPVYSKGDAIIQEQNTTKTLLDEHVQSFSSAVDPLEDRRVTEENLGMKSERSQSQQFFDDLQKCMSPCDVLDLVSKSSVSLKYCSSCFTTMWMLIKKQSEDQKRYEKHLMVEHPSFLPLCQHLMQESQIMWRDDLVYSLHAVLKLGVPQNTKLVQTLLRVCQERLNEFDDRCLSVLATSVETMECCRNVDALQAGLQLLVEQRILKISNIFSLQTIMKCIGKDAPFSLKRKFEVVLFLSAFEGVHFQPVELMDILAEKVTSHPESLNLKDILTVLRVYSLLNYVPKSQTQEFLESLNTALNKYRASISNVDLLKAVYSFCILAYLPQPAISQLLQEDNLNEILRAEGQIKEQNEMMLHFVNVCLELDGPSSFPKPTAVFVNKPPSPLVLNLSEVREALLTLLGNEHLFQQNVQLPHNYNIDFEIKMDPDRKKVLPVNEADDSADAPDVQRVAILCPSASAFCCGTRHPRGKLEMKMRHLKALGYHVILVHYQEFKKLKKEEAVEWLKKKIYSTDAFHVSDVNLQDNN
ncbi:FAST kinase domain-containing protein 2, mitochondrial isoform X2 [Carettochelys insculpta]|uniref:FAST kinase domain-containing protein 2, mitochondrial isoform X2 n=1 Tax=Carettochelys insculpta TaxID=44489 RepID=UPI003EB774B6